MSVNRLRAPISDSERLAPTSSSSLSVAATCFHAAPTSPWPAMCAPFREISCKRAISIATVHHTRRRLDVASGWSSSTPELSGCSTRVRRAADVDSVATSGGVRGGVTADNELSTRCLKRRRKIRVFDSVEAAWPVGDPAVRSAGPGAAAIADEGRTLGGIVQFRTRKKLLTLQAADRGFLENPFALVMTC